MSSRWSETEGDPRRVRWDRLEAMLDDLDLRGPKGFDPAKVRELTSLYRVVSSDLLEEVRRDSGSAASEYLRALVGRAHGMLHRGTPKPVWRAIARFFARDFPEVARRRIRAIALAALVFTMGAVYGATAYTTDPGAGEVLLPFGHRYMDASERVEEEETASQDVMGKTAVGTAFAAHLFTHNSRVTFLCFALAITGGIGIILLDFANGAYLGAVGAKYFLDGQGVFFAAWVGPHGVVEIPAVLLGSAAGLILARALFAPGIIGRRRALQEAGKDALLLLLGATATLVLAGGIEGTFSQLHEPVVPYALKIVFAAVLGVSYFAYLFLWPVRRLVRRRRAGSGS